LRRFESIFLKSLIGAATQRGGKRGPGGCDMPLHCPRNKRNKKENKNKNQIKENR